MVVTHPTTGDQLNIGLDVTSLPRLRQALEAAESSGCDFVLAPLVHPRYARPVELTPSPSFDAPHPPPIVRSDPLTRSDVELSSAEWQSGIIGKVSPWINTASSSPVVRAASEAAFREEVAYATHLGVRALVVDAPAGNGVRGAGLANYGRCIASALASGMQVASVEPWAVWNTVRTLCDNHANLGLALELSSELPSPGALDRWAAEAIRVVIMPTSSYVTNRVGYPVLSRRHQELIKLLFKYRPFFALSGRPAAVKGGDGMRPYVQYLAHLFGKQPPPSEAEAFEGPYYDYLQAPLQPLADNLESATYEVFERDPVKYERYEEAVRQALLHRTSMALASALPPDIGGGPTPAEAAAAAENGTAADGTDGTSAKDSTIVVMVLGAGRGPLVRATLRASASSRIPVRVVAVEKNPNAIVTLRNAALDDPAWSCVTVVSGDMRCASSSTTARADIVVSELLGSFGDNELSPECLDGAAALLKPDVISIPASYTSYLAPLSSARLHREVRGLGAGDTPFETAYVVRIHKGVTAAPSVPALTFVHPSDGGSNERHVEAAWVAAETNVIHGFAGYFEAVLFGDVGISIRPETASLGMFSWFPIYFPVKTPVLVAKGGTVRMHLWRRVGGGRVWYEWALAEPAVSAVHNVGGKSYSLGLTTG
ncbi:hypothetical protein I4F81_010006 [Pyropia yezoensis]|uniref:Uncharacterized protein n=1 Tax=Pyropia yezoensis TaxID=2788 RepID=A0ACC3CB39_PYRYE|nr:hypothetical protein I4F81_010006 [Neopyropia yezoensis]